MRLIKLQDTDGAFHYNWSFEHYATKETLSPHWCSAMAHGQILSVFARSVKSNFFLIIRLLS